ncbi:MAG: diguanylate cyclase [Proteobacteria bacterium]|nr:diguanylate cyclase [Pseudomonadota bacterium]
MTTITESKKKIFKLFLFLFFLIYIVSLKEESIQNSVLPKYRVFLNILVILWICTFLIIDSFKVFKTLGKSKLEIKHWDAFFWLSWIFLSILFFTTLEFNNFNFLPIFNVFFAVVFAFFPLKIALSFFILTIIVEYLYFCVFPWQRDYINYVFFVSMITIFSIFGYILKKERKERSIYESKLIEIKEGAKTFFSNEEENLDYLKAEKRLEHLQSTYGYFEERILKILQQIKDLIDPFTVAFFKIKEDSKYYKIFEAISESDYLRYNDDIPLDEGVVGWIFKHQKSLNISSVKGGNRALNYYDQELPIASFLGVPVFWRNNIVGVLCVDSLQDNAFNPDCENIVKLAVLQIQETMENIQLLQQTQQQYKEFSALYEGSKKMMATITLEDNLNIFLEIINQITHNDISILAIKDDSSDDAFTIRAVRGVSNEVIGKVVDRESLLYWVIEHKQYLDLRHYNSKKKIKPLISESLKISELQRVIIYPLMYEDSILGAFILGYKNEGPDDYEKRVIEILGNQASISISNAFLFEKVKNMATTDGLTGVFNHRHFQEKFSEVLLRAERYNEKFSLVLLDIDFFKKVNDTYGHQVGDIVLKKVAQILKSTARKVDIVARYGGEEFAIICVNDDKNNAVKFAERLRMEIENTTILFEGGKLNVTASLGVASYPEDGKDKVSLVEMADRALYKAKHEGRNRVVLA